MNLVFHHYAIGNASLDLTMTLCKCQSFPALLKVPSSYNYLQIVC